MFKKAITALLLSKVLTAQAGWNEWDSTDQALFVASSLAITADWATTRYGVRSPVKGVYETNPILGKYPTTSKVDAYFILLLATNYIAADLMPNEYRGLYLTVRTTSHGYAASKNIELGWRMRF